ncbi:UNVERIFIED_CONTAM: hypothetical protein HDU68_000669 [Siphonaria sp. JEL0065]|nr:hypothetical protein HDU68_000669 [Siphonaria sp. JEL0065]
MKTATIALDEANGLWRGISSGRGSQLKEYGSKMPPSPEPRIETEQKTYINAEGDTVTQTITKSTETVTILKPVEVVEEVVIHDQGPETVTEEGDLDMAWLAKVIADNEKIAGLELPEGLTSHEIVLLANAIKTNDVLDKLDLQGNEIDDIGLRAVAEGLAVNRGIEEFRIGNQTVVASDETERILAEAVFLNTNLRVFTYGFRNTKYQALVEEALARNNAAYITSRTQKVTKTVFVEEVKEITKVLATETEIQDDDDVVVAPAAKEAPVVAAVVAEDVPVVETPSCESKDIAVPVVAVAAAIPVVETLAADPVAVEEVTVTTTVTETIKDDLIDPSTGHVLAEKLTEKKEQDTIVFDEKLVAPITAAAAVVASIPIQEVAIQEIPTAPSSDADVSYVQVSDEESAPSIDKELLSLEQMEGNDDGDLISQTGSTSSHKKHHPHIHHHKHNVHIHHPKKHGNAVPADDSAAGNRQVPIQDSVDSIADAKNRRKFLLARLQALKSDDYETYEEYVEAQNALSLELVELNKYIPAGDDDVATAAATNNETPSSNGSGIDVFGFLGKAAAGLGKGLNAVAEGIEDGVSAVGKGVSAAGKSLNAEGSNGVYLDDTFEVVNALDQISEERAAVVPEAITSKTSTITTETTTATSTAPAGPGRISPAKKGRFAMTLNKPLSGRASPSPSPRPDATTPTPESVRASTYSSTSSNTTSKINASKFEAKPSTEIREEDYETYEEYLLAMQAASLEVVEGYGYRELTNKEIKIVEQETIGEENVFLAGLSKAVAGAVKNTVGAVEHGLHNVSDALKEAGNGEVLEEDVFESKTVEELTSFQAVEGADSAEASKSRRVVRVLRVEDFDTYEEYVAAQQATSLEVVENAAPAKPSKKTVEITRTKEVDSEINASEESGLGSRKSWYNLIVEPVANVASGAYNAVVRPDVSTPEAKERTEQGRANAVAASATVVGILGIVLFKVARS